MAQEDNKQFLRSLLDTAILKPKCEKVNFKALRKLLEESIERCCDGASTSRNEVSNISNKNVNLLIKEVDKKLTLTVALPEGGVCANLDNAEDSSKMGVHRKGPSIDSKLHQSADSKFQQKTMKSSGKVDDIGKKHGSFAKAESSLSDSKMKKTASMSGRQKDVKDNIKTGGKDSQFSRMSKKDDASRIESEKIALRKDGSRDLSSHSQFDTQRSDQASDTANRSPSGINDGNKIDNLKTDTKSMKSGSGKGKSDDLKSGAKSSMKLETKSQPDSGFKSVPKKTELKSATDSARKQAESKQRVTKETTRQNENLSGIKKSTRDSSIAKDGKGRAEQSESSVKSPRRMANETNKQTKILSGSRKDSSAQRGENEKSNRLIKSDSTVDDNSAEKEAPTDDKAKDESMIDRRMNTLESIYWKHMNETDAAELVESSTKDSGDKLELISKIDDEIDGEKEFKQKSDAKYESTGPSRKTKEQVGALIKEAIDKVEQIGGTLGSRDKKSDSKLKASKSSEKLKSKDSKSDGDGGSSARDKIKSIKSDSKLDGSQVKSDSKLDVSKSTGKLKSREKIGAMIQEAIEKVEQIGGTLGNKDKKVGSKIEVMKSSEKIQSKERFDSDGGSLVRDKMKQVKSGSEHNVSKSTDKGKSKEARGNIDGDSSVQDKQKQIKSSDNKLDESQSIEKVTSIQQLDKNESESSKLITKVESISAVHNIDGSFVSSSDHDLQLEIEEKSDGQKYQVAEDGTDRSRSGGAVESVDSMSLIIVTDNDGKVDTNTNVKSSVKQSIAKSGSGSFAQKEKKQVKSSDSKLGVSKSIDKVKSKERFDDKPDTVSRVKITVQPVKGTFDIDDSLSERDQMKQIKSSRSKLDVSQSIEKRKSREARDTADSDGGVSARGKMNLVKSDSKHNVSKTGGKVQSKEGRGKSDIDGGSSARGTMKSAKSDSKHNVSKTGGKVQSKEGRGKSDIDGGSSARGTMKSTKSSDSKFDESESIGKVKPKGSLAGEADGDDDSSAQDALEQIKSSGSEFDISKSTEKMKSKEQSNDKSGLKKSKYDGSEQKKGTKGISGGSIEDKNQLNVDKRKSMGAKIPTKKAGASESKFKSKSTDERSTFERSKKGSTLLSTSKDRNEKISSGNRRLPKFGSERGSSTSDRDARTRLGKNAPIPSQSKSMSKPDRSVISRSKTELKQSAIGKITKDHKTSSDSKHSSMTRNRGFMRSMRQSDIMEKTKKMIPMSERLKKIKKNNLLKSAVGRGRSFGRNLDRWAICITNECNALENSNKCKCDPIFCHDKKPSKKSKQFVCYCAKSYKRAEDGSVYHSTCKCCKSD